MDLFTLETALKCQDWEVSPYNTSLLWRQRNWRPEWAVQVTWRSQYQSKNQNWGSELHPSFHVVILHSMVLLPQCGRKTSPVGELCLSLCRRGPGSRSGWGTVVRIQGVTPVSHKVQQALTHPLPVPLLTALLILRTLYPLNAFHLLSLDLISF